MARELTWSPAARLDLKEIFGYIADEDPIAIKQPAVDLTNHVHHARHDGLLNSRRL